MISSFKLSGVGCSAIARLEKFETGIQKLETAKALPNMGAPKGSLQMSKKHDTKCLADTCRFEIRNQGVH